VPTLATAGNFAVPASLLKFAGVENTGWFDARELNEINDGTASKTNTPKSAATVRGDLCFNIDSTGLDLSVRVFSKSDRLREMESQGMIATCSIKRRNFSVLGEGLAIFLTELSLLIPYSLKSKILQP